MKWQGVFPAITTPFKDDLSIDFAALGAHVDLMLRAGSRGIVALGSLGESSTLTTSEKLDVLRTCRAATEDRVPLVAGIGAMSTAEAVRLSEEAARAGCEGLMVLPPYVYRGDWRETKSHFDAVISSTGLSCMLYNNPIAYGTDVLPEQVRELANEHANLHAVKESSADVRRLTALRALVGSRLALFVGVDDLILEGIDAGAVGWIAGLVNALPKESVDLFDLAVAGRREEARALYEWFLPLLRLDTVPKFVQLIKLVESELGVGSERVRPPRLQITGEEREAAMVLIRTALAMRPQG